MDKSEYKKKNSDMKARVISAAVMIVGAFTMMAVSRLTRILFLTAFSILSTREMAKELRKYSLDIKEVKEADEPETPVFNTKWPLLAISVIVMSALIWFRVDLSWYIAWFSCSVFLILFAEIVSKDWYIPERGRNAMGNVFCLVYPAGPFFLIIYYCAKDYWVGPFLLACIATWTCDSFALFGGRAFGKRKLASLVSPKKTWEGTLTGAASSLLAGVLVWALLRFIPFLKPYELPLVPCLVTALVSSTLGQLGDLAASLFKRMAGMKDYSNLIPGHGGAMDRVDSLLFSIPSTFFLLNLFGVLG